MFAALIATAASMQSAAQQKHVIAILADDYGWADAGWHRPEGYQEVSKEFNINIERTGCRTFALRCMQSS